jgi:hypothetical protein
MCQELSQNCEGMAKVAAFHNSSFFREVMAKSACDFAGGHWVKGRTSSDKSKMKSDAGRGCRSATE